MKKIIVIVISVIVLVACYLAGDFVFDRRNDEPVFGGAVGDFICGAPKLQMGDKVRYIGDIPSAYNKVGWVSVIENKMSDKIHNNPTPYMIAFPEEIDHMEEVAKWKKHWEENKGDYSSYGASHPFPYGLSGELKWGFNNRVWASADQLELISTSHKKNIKEGEEALMPISLETLDIDELNNAKKALVSPNSLNIEIKQ